MSRRCALLLAGLVAAGPMAAAGDAERGASRAAVCGGCHGNAERAPLPATPSLAGQQAEFLVLQMFYLREGLRDVPQMEGSLEGFSDPDLEDVAAYFAAQARPSISGNCDPQIYRRGQELARGLACDSCHLKDFRGQRQIPRISSQSEDYLAASLRAFRDDRRSGTDTNMNAAVYGLGDADIQALAHYLAQQK